MNKFTAVLNRTLVFSAPIIIYLLSRIGDNQALVGLTAYLLWVFSNLESADWDSRKNRIYEEEE
jgi:hypothetical protein